MKKKRMLTLEDLFKFCKSQKLYSFSSKEKGYQLCVAVPAHFEKEDESSSSLLFADIKAFHTGKNENNSNVIKEAMQKSLPTFANKPILAAFTKDKNGNDDFMSHEMEIDDDGNVVYIEQQVGNFTADEPWIKQDPNNPDKDWVFAKAAIPREYTHAADIIERKGGTRVSVELIVNKFSYDENEDVLLLEDIEVSGLTLLGIYEEGADPETDYVREGMKGARLDIADFGVQKNCSFLHQELVDVIKEIVVQSLNDIEKSKEGGNKMKFSQEKLNELLEKYAVKSEDITFDLEAIESDEALEKAFEAQFSNPSPEQESKEDIKFSVEFSGGTKTFAKSLNDQIRAITELVNATYGEADNAWYDCEVFDDKTIVFHDWWNNKHFKQKFGNKDGNLVLKGERCEVYARFLTQEEIAALEDLQTRFNAKVKEFDEVKIELEHYHDEPKKQKILSDEAYSSVFESTDFMDLKKQETHFNMSIEDVQAKADAILLAAAKAGKVEFAKNKDDDKSPVGSKPLPHVNNTKRRYGSLLEDI